MKETYPIILLPDYSQQLSYINLLNNGKLEDGEDDPFGSNPHHLYILVQTEIQEDEWAIASNNTNGIVKDFEDCVPFKANIPYAASVYVWKIIATTDPNLIRDGVEIINHMFINKYIWKWNNSEPITEVELGDIGQNGYIEIFQYKKTFTGEETKPVDAKGNRIG